MNDYKDLKTLYHINSSNKEYENRINSYASYVIDINLNPIEKGNFYKKSYPIFLFNTKTLTTLTEKILTNNKKIELLKEKLPLVALNKFVNMLLINELKSTNEIEQIRSTKKELAEAIQNVNINNSNQKRFVSLAKMYKNLDKNDVEKVADFRKVYDLLVADEVEEKDKLDGELFRKGEVEVSSNNKVYHRGIPTEEKITELLEELILFLKQEEMPKLYKYMVAHYVFEYIHPFYDGNGRVGRYLLGKHLNSYLDNLTAITLSYTINQNKNKYYKSFEEVSHPLNKMELTFFVENMLTFLVEGQESILQYLVENINKLQVLAEKLVELNNETEKNIFYLLMQSYLFSAKDDKITVNEIADELSVDRKTVQKYLEKNLDKVEKIKSKPVIYILKDEYVNS